jgi:heavy metal efflux system protein
MGAMSRAVETYPGAISSFSHPIEDNVGETMTGTKGSLALKIFGDDLKTVAQKGEEATTVMSAIPGMHDVKRLTSSTPRFFGVVLLGLPRGEKLR